MKHITLINVDQPTNVWRIAAHVALFILIMVIAGHLTGMLFHY